jgi:hypothetical protein
MNVPPPASSSTPQTVPSRARARAARGLLVDLAAMVRNPKFQPSREPGQIIFLAGELGLREAEPLLLRLASLDDRRNYSVCRALGQVGSAAAVSTVGKLFTDPRSSPALRHIAGEALLRLSGEAGRPAFRAQLQSLLPDALRAAVDAGDPDAFAAALAAHLAPPTDERLAILDSLYLIEGPVIRPSILHFARTAPLAPPTFRRLRALFKSAEYRRDGELFGILVHRFETGKPGGGARRYQHADLARQGKAAFGPLTRDYLRRRAWRTLERLGRLDDPDFLPMAVGVLLPFSDSDAHPVRDRTGLWRGTYYPPFSPYRCFNKLLLRHRARLLWGRRLFVSDQSKDSALAPRRPGEEAFPDRWQARPAGLLHLLDESRCAPVHEFAALALGACEEFCAGLDREVLLMLLSRPYAPTAALGFSLIQRRYDPRAPDLELLALLVGCAHPPARRAAFGWLDQLGPRVLDEVALLASLIASRHEDARDHARRLLGSRPMTDAQAQALLWRVIGLLLALGPDDGEIARGAARTLLQWFGPQLAAIRSSVVVDLLAHPLPAVQAFGAEILVFARVAVSDETLLSLLDSPATDVRAAGLLLLEQLTDAVLPDHLDLIARLLALKAPETRAAARRLARRLAVLGAAHEQALATRVIEAILRRKLPEGVAAELPRSLREDLPGALAGLDADAVWRLLSSASPEAQSLGDVLLARRDLGAVLTVDQIGKLASQETLALREAAWGMFERHPARVKDDLAGAIRVLDSRWGDTRVFAFRFFREHFAPGELPAATLVAICDSTRPDVQDFGREMLTKHAREEDGLELLWRLSEHPAPAVQLHVTEWLDRHAAGEPARLAALEPYFLSVLSRVNRGRQARQRVFAFLRREGERSLEAAQVVAPILQRISASSSVEHRALALAALVALGRAHPSAGLASPARVIPREARDPAAQEARRGIQLYVPG